jgi:hypothetical protein
MTFKRKVGAHRRYWSFDFAGTVEEATAFADEHGFRVAKVSPSGEYPLLYIAITTDSHCKEVERFLNKEGWDSHAIHNSHLHPHKEFRTPLAA